MHQHFTKPIVLHSKSVGFARQKRLFCIAKQPLSHRQTEITVFRRKYLYKMGDLFETARKKHWKLQWKILKLRYKNFGTTMQEIWNCNARILRLP